MGLTTIPDSPPLATSGSAGAESAAQFADIADIAPLTAADATLIHLGAKSAASVTLTAFGTWADGHTIVLPGIGSHTLKVTTTGDIDIVGLGEAAAKAAIVAYLNTHAGATVSVAIVGTSTTMTVTALAYGATLNNTSITGTLLSAPGTMAGGKAALATIDLNNLLLGGAAASANASLAVLATKTIAVPASGSVWNGLDIQASTLTLAAGGTVPTALSLAYLAAPTITSAAAYVVPTAATLTIVGPPVAGGALTIANPVSLAVLTGRVGIGTNVPQVALDITTLQHIPAAIRCFQAGVGGFTIGVPPDNSCVYISNTGFGDDRFGNPLNSISVGLGGEVGIGAAGLYDGPRLKIDATKTIASAAGAVWDGIKFAASTASITGATGITALSFTTIQAPTISGDTATCAIDTAASLYVSGAPIAGTNVTIARPWGIRVDAGVQITAGNLVLGSAVTAGATADKCLALHNGATAPSASADLCHLYCADNGAGHATLAIYQEEVVAAVGIKLVTQYLPVVINGVVKNIALVA